MDAAKPLKIVVLSRMVEVRVNETTVVKQRVYDPVDAHFSDIVARALGFSYELTYAKDGEMGRPLDDGNWTGVIGMVQRGEADFSISTAALTKDRSEVVSCSYPYECVRMTFATRNPEYSFDTMGFLKPFSFPVWLLLLLFLVIMSLTLFAVFDIKHSFQKLALHTLGAYLRQPFDIQPQKMSQFVALFSWIVGMMFLSYCYTAVLLASLTFPLKSGVRTIPELASEVRKGTYQCFAIPGTYLIQALLSSSDTSSQIIGRDLLTREGTMDIEETLRNAASSKIPAFIAGTNMFASIKERYFVSKDTFFPIFLMIPMRENFCCKKRLNKVISHVWAGGLYQKIVNDNGFITNMKKRLHSSEETNTERKLTLSNFFGEFMILIGGLILSFIVFLFEYLIGKRIMCINRS